MAKNMAKKYDGSPLFHMRMKEDLYDWLRGYSKRVGKPMSVIIKEYLEKLRHEDKDAKYTKQGS